MEEYFEGNPAISLMKELKLSLIEERAHSTVQIEDKVYVYKGNGDRDAYLDAIFTPDEKEAYLKWNNTTWELYKELRDSYFLGKPLPPNLKDLMRISFANYI